MQPERNRSIDALRGLSLIIVITHHTSLRIPLARTAFATLFPHPVISVFAWGGQDAVTIFFVISGFLITRRTLDRHVTLSSLNPARFLMHRAARILPCLIILLLILTVLDLIGWSDYSFKPTQSLPGALFAALTFHLNWWEGQNGWAPPNWDVLWSLSVEEVFYLGFPLLCLIGPRFRLLILLALVIIGPLDHAAITANEIWQEKAYLPGFGAIAAGVLAALATTRFKAPKWLALPGLLLMAVELFDSGWLWHHIGSSILWCLTIGTALTLSSVHFHDVLPTTGTAWLRTMGRNSYEIYLTHMFVVLPAVAFYRASGLSASSGAMLYPSILATTALFGAAVARLLSRPAAHWLDRRLQNPNIWSSENAPAASS